MSLLEQEGSHVGFNTFRRRLTESAHHRERPWEILEALAAACHVRRALHHSKCRILSCFTKKNTEAVQETELPQDVVIVRTTLRFFIVGTPPY